jgi:putative toxin-antitoxin system antitoxin component (TIGR02293 family)
MAQTQTDLATQVMELLSVPSSRRVDAEPDEILQRAVRKGLPFASVKAILKQLDVSQAALAAVLGIPTRTMARRQVEHHLRPDESDRLYRVARAVAFARSVLGDLSKSRRWLITPNRALGNETPLSLLDTDIGSRRVEEVLERINYGIFS